MNMSEASLRRFALDYFKDVAKGILTDEFGADNVTEIAGERGTIIEVATNDINRVVEALTKDSWRKHAEI